jgi:hypothetical protein
MPEALTESFCERCGTRYEFKAPTRLNPLRKTRGVVSGLKNYIMSQDALGDAMADAMRSEQDALAAAQLDAFHASFNFCIDCRQYTCLNCWNDEAGRCRSCAPIAGTDDLAERLEAGLTLHAGAPATNGSVPPVELGQDEIGRRLGVDAWPTADLDELRAEVTPSAVETMPAVEAAPELGEPEPFSTPFVLAQADEDLDADADADADLRAPASAEIAAESLHEPEPVEPLLAAEAPLDEPAPEAAVPEPSARPVLGWDADDSFELIAFPTPVVEEPPAIEFAVAPELATEEPAWSYEDETPVAESNVPLRWAEAPDLSPAETEFAAEAQPAPTAEPEPESEPQTPAPAAREESAPPVPPADAPPPQIRPAPTAPRRRQPAAADRVAATAAPAAPPEVTDPVLVARRAQLDLLGLGDAASGGLADESQPLPYRSSGASVHPTELAARLAAQQQAARQQTIGSPAQTIRASMWDASAREVAGASAQVGVQSCGGCGLSLSATARFCRRCGTRQAQPA